MATVAHLSDVHFIQSAHHFRRLVEVVRSIVRDAAAHHVDAFLIGGDQSGRETNHKMTIAERMAWVEVVTEMAEVAPVAWIRGNHGYVGDEEIFGHLHTKHPVMVSDADPGLHRVGPIYVAGIPYLPQPQWAYDDDSGSINERNERAASKVYACANALLADVPPDATRVLLAHYPVAGVGIGSYVVESSQDVVLAPDHLAQMPVDYVALGHIHEEQDVCELGGYCGSPATLDHGESGPKGYRLVEVGRGAKPQVTFRAMSSWGRQTIPVRVEADGNYVVTPTSVTLLQDAYVRYQLHLPPDWKGRLDGMKAELRAHAERAGALEVSWDTVTAGNTRSRSIEVVQAVSDHDKLRAALNGHERTTEIVGLFDEMRAEMEQAQ